VVERARRIVLAREVRRLAGRVPVLEADAEADHPSRGWSAQRREHRDAVQDVVPQHDGGIGNRGGKRDEAGEHPSEAADIARCMRTSLKGREARSRPLAPAGSDIRPEYQMRSIGRASYRLFPSKCRTLSAVASRSSRHRVLIATIGPVWTLTAREGAHAADLAEQVVDDLLAELVVAEGASPFSSVNALAGTNESKAPVRAQMEQFALRDRLRKVDVDAIADGAAVAAALTGLWHASSLAVSAAHVSGGAPRYGLQTLRGSSRPSSRGGTGSR